MSHKPCGLFRLIWGLVAVCMAWLRSQMDAIHMLAEDHYNENRFQLAYIFALRAAQLKQPENMASTRSVLLRDTEHLYKWEGIECAPVLPVRRLLFCASHCDAGSR